MKLFSENENHFGGECEKCGKVLKIKREFVITTKQGFSLNNPIGIKCLCGMIHHNMDNGVSIPADPKRTSSSPKQSSCRVCGKMVATEAESCPHCGIAKPGAASDFDAKIAQGEDKFNNLLSRIIPIILVLVLLSAFTKCSSQ